MVPTEPCGWLVVDKPADMTSHDVIARLRRATGYRRFGHSGTLDPGATGVLVLAVGAATRLIQYLPNRKVYQAVVRLGTTTDTQDAAGNVLKTRPVPDLSQEQIVETLHLFQGKQRQRPPMVSAVHYQGRRLYELARAGQEVPDRPDREVVIHRIDLLDLDLPDLSMEVDCSGGTYVRTLAHDLGEHLGCGAHLLTLRRLQANGLAIDQARSLAELLEQKATLLEQLLEPNVPLNHLPSLRLPQEAVRQLQQGHHPRWPKGADQAGLCCVFSEQDGRLRAVAERSGVRLIPRTVLPP